MSDLKHWIEWSPAFDKRHTDPDKNYGIHSVDMRWYTKGELGVVQFVLYTGWHLSHVRDEILSRPPRQGFTGRYTNGLEPLAADLGYHSPKALYEGQCEMQDCTLLDGPCFYDGSSLNADPVFDLLCEKGEQAVWDHLDDYYRTTFLEREAIA